MMLQTKNLTFFYNKDTQFAFPELRCDASNALLITGNSGKGKTTLLHLLAGLLRPKKGEISIEKTNISSLSEKQLDQFRGKTIGLILQQSHFIASMTVLENVVLASWLATGKKHSKRAMSLLEKLDVGNYLIYIETPNDTISTKKVFDYTILQVTNLYVIEDNEENKDAFYIYDRKLGKPLEDVKIASEEENIKTNANGNAYFKHKWRIKDKKYSNDILITSKNDSLSINYNRNFLSTNEINNKSVDDYENWEAKAMIYFDRAIYRPGQKMLYKGVIIQKKDAVKNVVPFVTVHVTISDVNNTKLKEYDVQTISLEDLLIKYSAPKKIDYLSIDTEGSEYEILSNFNFDAYDIRAITCEHNYMPEREQIYKLLTSKGYFRVDTDKSKWDDWYTKAKPVLLYV